MGWNSHSASLWALRLFFLCSVLSVGYGRPLNASPLPDLLLLRDVICERESGGMEDRDDAIGKAGEIGRCQIRPGTARQVGYQGKNRDLFDKQTNEYVALLKLVACSRKYVTVKG